MPRRKPYQIRKGKFRIVTGEGWKGVDGWISSDGLLGIHQEMLYCEVTHMKTGYAIPYTFDTIEMAKKFCRLIRDEKFLRKSLKQFTQLSRNYKCVLRARLAAYHDEACKENK